MKAADVSPTVAGHPHHAVVPVSTDLVQLMIQVVVYWTSCLILICCDHC